MTHIPGHMEPTIRNLGVLAYTNGFTQWHYKAVDEKITAVEAPNYFGKAAEMLAEGDMIHVSAADGGAIYFVTRSDEGVVLARMCATVTP